MLVIFEGPVWSDSIAYTCVIYEIILCPQHERISIVRYIHTELGLGQTSFCLTCLPGHKDLVSKPNLGTLVDFSLFKNGDMELLKTFIKIL